MKQNLTQKQQTFVRLVIEGMSCMAAAKHAGYSRPQTDGWAVMHTPYVREAIRERREGRFTGDLGTLAISTIEWCMRNGPPIVKLNAAKFTLQVAGIVEKTKFNTAEPGKKSLVEMSEQELIEFVRGKEKELLVLEAGEVKNVSNTSEIDELLS